MSIKHIGLLAVILIGAIIMGGCSSGKSNTGLHQDTVNVDAQPAAKPEATAGMKVPQATGIIQTTPLDDPTPCTYPAGWQPHQVQEGETIKILAARFSITPDEMLNNNCHLPASGNIAPGMWLYTPVEIADSHPQTYLPLGISLFVADPTVVEAGGTVTLTWQSQGAVQLVRLGWVYNNQFIEEIRGVPPTGVWQMRVPADGRNTMTFMVRVSDGIQEVAAQTTVQVLCPESWFFQPHPENCPAAPMMTEFHEQHFERGTIVYIPTLGIHYILINGQPSIEFADSYIPGMPSRDVFYDIPEGFFQPEGPIFYAWRTDANIQAALGYAISQEVVYTGMLQRTIYAGRPVIYVMAASGHIYQIINGQPWGVIVPQ